MNFTDEVDIDALLANQSHGMTNISEVSLNFAVRYSDDAIKSSLPVNISYSLNLEAAVTCSTLSLITFLLLALLLFLYYRGDDEVGNCGAPNNSLLLFLGVVVTTVTALSVPNYDENIYRWYLLFLLFVVGVVVVVLGAHFFFRVPKNSHERPLSYNHENLSTLIWIITIPLALMELMELIGAVHYKVQDHKIKAAVDVMAIIQKLTQASLYHFSLRHKRGDCNMKEGASWYLKLVSLFNFTMWLDSMVTTSEGNIKMIFGQGWSIINTANIALLIDYRLLCCLLFAEHAMEINEEEEEEEEEEGRDRSNTVVVPDERHFKIRVSQLSGLGFMFGFTILATQLVSGLQSYDLVGAWSNIFSILADVFVVVMGLALVFLDESPKMSFSVGGTRKSDAKGVDLMVAMMGIVGFLFWIVMATFNGSWVYKVPLNTRSLSYLKWSCAKNVVRSIGIVFQLYIFIKCDSRFGCRKNVRESMWKYFLIPSLMFSLLSVFVMAIMDGHSEIVEVLIEASNISPILTALLKVSEPLYLGYCLHLFLHFFIVYTNVRGITVREVRGDGGDGTGREDIPLKEVTA